MSDDAMAGQKSMSIDHCMLNAAEGMEQTDAAIARAKAKLEEIDAKFEQMKSADSTAVFKEIASELNGHSLSHAKIITQLTVRSHQLLSNLSRLRGLGKRNSE